ncbi:DNA topoisomerase I [Candidatus Altiarchaeota archaeon]
MPTLIVTEKPNVAERIAKSLGDPVKKTGSGVAYYQVGDVYIAPAVGHLYGLKERNFKGWVYPVFDIEWVPSHTLNPSSKFTEKYLSSIESLAKKCDTVINACDYDIEGEVIGFNVIKHACHKDPYSSHVKRMKYSTLTRESILAAFGKLEKIDKGMAEAGITRHILDWYWGINLSRALSNSARKARKYVTLSIGRVQGPTLKILATREKLIKAFNPETYWQVELHCIKDKIGFIALHIEEKFSDPERAKKIKENCGPKATVTKVNTRKHKQTPPCPFDLTTLQTEAYRHHKIDPRTTLKISQDLYTSALISYPRTSSQQIPPDIDCRKIISDLRKLSAYEKLCETLLKNKALKPANGKKKDPAHPAIHPTGEKPGKLDGYHEKIYDLIVRRFLATFGDDAQRQTITADLDNNGEDFKTKGTTTLEPGWHVYYGPYAKFEEIELPNLAKGDIVDVKDIKLLEKETQPPKRYTPASIIREMEKKDIGTKATRSQIVDILFRRGYLDGRTIEVTDLGINVVDTLDKYCPEVISESLTRNFEQEMEKITAGKATMDDVVGQGRQMIEKISKEFKLNEEKIGASLGDSIVKSQRQANSLGPCKTCKGTLVIRKSRFGGHFIGCDAYPKCTFTLPLPKSPVKKTGTCKKCGYAIITAKPKGKRPWRFCANPDCETRIDKKKREAAVPVKEVKAPAASVKSVKAPADNKVK